MKKKNPFYPDIQKFGECFPLYPDTHANFLFFFGGGDKKTVIQWVTAFCLLRLNEGGGGTNFGMCVKPNMFNSILYIVEPA